MEVRFLRTMDGIELVPYPRIGETLFSDAFQGEG